MSKDLSQLFVGIFFFTSFIYFVTMYIVLKDIKHPITNAIYAQNRFGETKIVSKPQEVLEPLNVN